MNRLILFLIVVMFEAFVSSITATGQIAGHARFVAAKDGHPGAIDIGQYLAMEDPVEGGRLLMAESQEAGMNLDDSSHVLKVTEPVFVPSGHIDSSAAYQFMRRVKEEPQPDKPEMRAYLVRYRRSPTIRETATAMSHGVRHQRGASGPARVVAMKSDQVAAFSSLPYVQWIRPYLPEFKIWRHGVFKKDSHGATKMFIYSIAGDLAAWREDVRRCGGVRDGGLVADHFYQTTVPYDSIASIVRLWWVVRIEPGMEASDD